jgi:tetratricopeptide (TPR) repeat protein
VSNRYRCPLLAAVFLGVCGGARSQSPGDAIVKGEVHSESAGIEHYSAQLDDLQHHQRIAAVDVRSDGTFEFRNVPQGEYTLRITDLRGAEVYVGFASVNQTGSALQIWIPNTPKARPPSGQVSAADLLHPPNRKAYQAVVAAQAFSESGQVGKAAEQLEKAVKLSPDYATAHTNLAAAYIKLGRYEEALDEVSRAIAAGKPNARDLSNRAFAQAALRRYGEALESARQAVEIDPSSAQAQYMLGSILAADDRTLAEAIPHLARAARELPSAGGALERAQKTLVARTSRPARQPDVQ